jgi:transcriptional regulator with XRE-family HTH domain
MLPSFAIAVKGTNVNKETVTIQKFGTKVRYLRERSGLTQSELAEHIGLSTQSKGFISEIESGKKIPRAEWIVRLALYFNVTTDYLLLDSIERDA